MPPMPNKLSMPLGTASYNGRFEARWPGGDRPNLSADLAAGANVVAAGSADMQTAIRMDAIASGIIAASGGLVSDEGLIAFDNFGDATLDVGLPIGRTAGALTYDEGVYTSVRADAGGANGRSLRFRYQVGAQGSAVEQNFKLPDGLTEVFCRYRIVVPSNFPATTSLHKMFLIWYDDNTSDGDRSYQEWETAYGTWDGVMQTSMSDGAQAFNSYHGNTATKGVYQSDADQEIELAFYTKRTGQLIQGYAWRKAPGSSTPVLITAGSRTHTASVPSGHCFNRGYLLGAHETAYPTEAQWFMRSVEFFDALPSGYSLS